MENTKDIVFSTKDYIIEKLNIDNNLDQIQRLCEDCSDYYEFMEGRNVPKEAGKELFYDVPPGRSIEDKVVLGIYSVGQNDEEPRPLIGIIDMIKGYPKKYIWYIGLMMIKPSMRGNGIGKKVFKEYVKWVSKNEGKSIKVGVLEENKKAYKFWENIGFKMVKEISDFEIGNKVTTVHVMDYEIKYNNK